MRAGEQPLSQWFFGAIWDALGGGQAPREGVHFLGEGALSSAFAVTDLAAASFAAAGAALAELMAVEGGQLPSVAVDRVLSSGWFRSALRPIGWRAPSPWHEISGAYQTADHRWLRLQANYPHLRQAILSVLGAKATRADVAQVIARGNADELEHAIVDGGGTAAASRSLREWAEHPQGKAVGSEPLVAIARGGTSDLAGTWHPLPGRPLGGLRILDLTRVLAGPMGTRLLAGYGAEVLRIDPPGYEEPGSTVELTVGKRCAVLDLRTDAGRRRLLDLLSGADVLVHGYRPGALQALGLGESARAAIQPGLIEVTLDAYGWTGPWRTRRGFDTLVQVSSGIAHEEAGRVHSEEPTLMPVQALDMATGYLMAASVIRGLTLRQMTGCGSEMRCSLARTAALLVSAGSPPRHPEIRLPVEGPLDQTIAMTPLGPAQRLVAPVRVERAPLFWERPGEFYGSSSPEWATVRPPRPAP